MKGDISVTSKVAEGSKFKVVIPDVKTGVSEYRVVNNFDAGENIIFENSSVLIIDDIESNVEVVEVILNSVGLTTSSAENGEIAFEILNHIKPDLILLDIRMPGIDGYEVARRIKANSDLAHIPVLAFTASVFSSDKIEKFRLFR